MSIPLVRSAIVLAIGTAVGQALVLIATPFLARFYLPAQFGSLALLMTISNVAVAMASLRFDQAIPSAPEEQVPGLVTICIISSLLVGLALGSGVFLLERDFGFGAPLWAVSVMVGLTVFLAGVSQAYAAWCLRVGKVRLVAELRISQGFSFVSLACFPAVGILWAHAISFFGGMFFLRAPRSSLRVAWSTVRINWRFPLMSLPGAAFDVLGYSCLIWVISSVYGETEAGHYSQVQRLVGAPLMLAGISLGQVLLRRTAVLLESPQGMGQVRSELGKAFLMMAGGSLLVLLVLGLCGDLLFHLLLGPGWKTDARFLLLIGIAVGVRATVAPLSMVLITLRRFDLTLLWQGSYFASASILLALVANRAEFDQFIAFYAMHEFCFYGIYLMLIRYSVRR